MAIKKKKPAVKVIHPIFLGANNPSISDDYAWLDYYELICLTGKDKRLPKGSIVEDLDTIKGVSPQLLLMAANDGSIQWETEADEMEEEEEEEEEEADERVEELLGKNESMARGILFGLSFRQRVFGDWYPFSLEGDEKDELVLLPLTAKRLVYVQLLLSSGLRMIPKERWKDVTEPFEDLSAVIFKKLMPMGWEVHRFGAKGTTRYKGSLYQKLKSLGSDIKSEFTAKPYHFKKGNNADGGIDLVAWNSLGDLREGSPAALAQCGCTLDGWPNKALEASPARLKNTFRPLIPWLPYFFTPHDLLLEVGGKQDWQRGNDVCESIFIDRYRITKILETHGTDAAAVYDRKLIAELVSDYSLVTI